MSNSNERTDQRTELRKKLRAKIEEGSIKRSTKEVRQKVLDKTLKDMGIDKDKLKEDMDRLNKENGGVLEFQL
jgi:hypothetical protein